VWRVRRAQYFLVLEYRFAAQEVVEEPLVTLVVVDEDVVEVDLEVAVGRASVVRHRFVRHVSIGYPFVSCGERRHQTAARKRPLLRRSATASRQTLQLMQMNQWKQERLISFDDANWSGQIVGRPYSV